MFVFKMAANHVFQIFIKIVILVGINAPRPILCANFVYMKYEVTFHFIRQSK